jgi:hypothetical protein
VKHLKELDEAILKYITAIVWWADVRFSKDNVWCAKALYIVLPTILLFVVGTLACLMAEDVYANFTALSITVLYGFISLSVWWYVHFVFSFSPYIDMVKDANKTPNPNKHKIPAQSLKIFYMALVLFVLLNNVKEGTNILAFVFFPIPLSIYALCVDNILPDEKRKRQEANKTKI